MNQDLQIVSRNPLIQTLNNSREDIQTDFCCQTLHKPNLIVKQKAEPQNIKSAQQDAELQAEQKHTNTHTYIHSRVRSKSRIRINPVLALIGEKKVRKTKEIISKRSSMRLTHQFPRIIQNRPNTSNKDDLEIKTPRCLNALNNMNNMNNMNNVNSLTSLNSKNITPVDMAATMNQEQISKYSLANLVTSSLFLTSAKKTRKLDLISEDRKKNPLIKRFSSTEKLRPSISTKYMQINTVNSSQPPNIPKNSNIFIRSNIHSIIGSPLSINQTPLQVTKVTNEKSTSTSTNTSLTGRANISRETKRSKKHKMELIKQQHKLHINPLPLGNRLDKDFVFDTISINPIISAHTLNQNSKRRDDVKAIICSNKYTNRANKINKEIVTKGNILNIKGIEENRQIGKNNEFKLEDYFNKKHNLKSSIECQTNTMIIPFVPKS